MIANKKAQAAIEFLTTYGWALLVIAIVLVALGWLGVFSPQKVIQEYCSFPIGTFECADNNLVYGEWGPQNYLHLRKLEVVNNFGRDIWICNIACSAEPADPQTGYPKTYASDISSVDACGDVSSKRIASGAMGDVAAILLTERNVACRDSHGNIYAESGVGEQYRGRIYLFYSYEGESTGNARLIAGDLVTKVQPA